MKSYCVDYMLSGYVLSVSLGMLSMLCIVYMLPTSETTPEIDVVSAEVYKIIIIMLNAKRSKCNEEVVSANIPTQQWICVWSGERRIRVSTFFFLLLLLHQHATHRHESKACIVSSCVNLLLNTQLLFSVSLSHTCRVGIYSNVHQLRILNVEYAQWRVYVTVIHFHCIRNVRIVWKRIFLFVDRVCSVCIVCCRIRDGRMMRARIYEWHEAAHHSLMPFGREWEELRKKKRTFSVLSVHAYIA